MKMIEHTFSATSITATELDTSTLPAEFVGRLISAANAVANMIGNCAIVPADDGDTGADEVATELTTLMSEAWRLHGKPAAIDPALLRQYFNEHHAAEAAAASAISAHDPDDDSGAALVL